MTCLPKSSSVQIHGPFHPAEVLYMHLSTFLYIQFHIYTRSVSAVCPVPSLGTDCTAQALLQDAPGHLLLDQDEGKPWERGWGEQKSPPCATGLRRRSGGHGPRPPVCQPFSGTSVAARPSAIHGCAALSREATVSGEARAAASRGEPRGAAGGSRALPDGPFHFPGV